MIEDVILLLLVFVSGFVIWWFFIKKDEKKEKTETDINIKANGTFTESFVPYPSQLTEYFVYDTNEVNTIAPSGETITITENDPYEFLYYKSSKTDRPTIWEGGMPIPWEKYRDCPSTDGCVTFNALNKELVEMMLNDAKEHMTPLLRKFREYLVSVGLETPDKMNAKYSEYVPGGYAEYWRHIDSRGRPTNESINSSHKQFEFDILFKGFADFLKITFINYDDYERMTRTEQENAIESIYSGLSSSYDFIHQVTLGSFYTKDNRVHVKQNPNNPEVSLTIGHDIPIVVSLFYITIVKELSGVRIDKFNYEPPSSELKTFKQIKDSFDSKMSSQMGIGS